MEAFCHLVALLGSAGEHGVLHRALHEELQVYDQRRRQQRVWNIHMSATFDLESALLAVATAKAPAVFYLNNTRKLDDGGLLYECAPLCGAVQTSPGKPWVALAPDMYRMLPLYKDHGIPVFESPLADVIRQRVEKEALAA